MGDDYVPGGLDPAVAVIESGMGADCGDHSAGSDAGTVGLFEDDFQGAAEVVAALFVQSHSAGVAIDGGIAAKMVMGGNVGGILPTQVIGFDVFAVGMIADLAFARVTQGNAAAGATALAGWRSVREAATAIGERVELLLHALEELDAMEENGVWALIFGGFGRPGGRRQGDGSGVEG